MIQLFRKIRQNLLSEGKTGKYFQYAVGEIVLVVIGILIALQINNWNDIRKNSKAESQYYCKLLEDFELDRTQLVSVKESIDLSIENTNEALLTLDAGNKDRHYLMNKYVSAVRRDIYVPHNKTFEELIYSGNLKIISDQEVKNVLLQYNSDLESNLTVIQKNRDEFVKEIYKLTNTTVDFGLHEIEFVKEMLTPEVIEILPKDNWTKDKDSMIYKDFQKILLFNLTTAAREKQVIEAIIDLMEPPKKLLKDKCRNLN